MEATLGIFIVALVFVAAYFIDKVWDKLPRNSTDWWDVREFAEYAVRSARVATNSPTNAELAQMAGDAIRAKFPNVKDVEVDVAIGAALDKLGGEK